MVDQISNFSLQAYSSPKQTIKSLAASVNAKAKAFKPEEGANGFAKKDPNISKAAKEFEASFLTTMLEQMWTGVEAEAPFGGGHAEKVYRSMVVGEYAKSIAAAGGIGIADHVYREILSAQEGQK